MVSMSDVFFPSLRCVVAILAIAVSPLAVTGCSSAAMVGLSRYGCWQGCSGYDRDACISKCNSDAEEELRELKAKESGTEHGADTRGNEIADDAPRKAIRRKLEECKVDDVSLKVDLTASSLIGENVCSGKMQALLSTLRKSQSAGDPGEPIITPMGPTYELDFPSRGIGLFFNSDSNSLGSELIYFDPIKPGVKRYEGKLPLGLSSQHTRKKAEAILGRPSSSAGIPGVGWQVAYGSKGLVIVYQGEQPDSPNARMRYMIFSKQLR
jgi:hypothetical protein